MEILRAENLNQPLEKLRSKNVPLKEKILDLLLTKEMEINKSKVFHNVFHNIGVSGIAWHYWFAPDIDLLEIKEDNMIVGYELKGYRKRKGEYEPPALYEGLDQALAYLRNPTIVWKGRKGSFNGSIFDHVYLVHSTSDVDQGMMEVIDRCTPIGFILVDYTGIKEMVKPKKNPLVNKSIQQLFLDNLNVMTSYGKVS